MSLIICSKLEKLYEYLKREISNGKIKSNALSAYE